MTTYNTRNPVGSTDVRDLYDNVQNLDSMVNGPLTSYADRLGAPRKSWRGMEQDFAAFLAASGFELPALEYVGGSPLVVDRPTQLIFRTGFPDTLYGVKSTEPFPATLTGTWATDESRLVVRSDGDLRQDLANSTDPAKGAGLVGWTRKPLAQAISTVGHMLSAQWVNVWEFAGLITSKPSPTDASTWDWTPAVQAAIDAVSPVGAIEFPDGTYKFSGVSTSKTVSIFGRGAGVTVLQNYTAGATMLNYDHAGMSDKDRRNWVTFEGFTIIDEASFTGIGIKTNNVLSIIFRDCYVREFKTNYGLQILEALWVYIENTHSDLCELNFVSTLVPHFNNQIVIKGGELRNPTPGRSALYIETGDVISVQNVTIEGNAGGSGYISGAKFKSVKLLNIDNCYFEVLQGAVDGALSLDGCQAVRISGGQLNSQSTTVPSVRINECDSVQFNRSAMVFFPLRTVGVNSVALDGCLIEGPIDTSASTVLEVISPVPYNTRAVIPMDLRYQKRGAGLPRAFRNTYADSEFITGAPGVTIVGGAPVSSHDTTQGYYGTTSWRVAGVAGDTIRTASLGTTEVAGQSGCMTFMAKADVHGRFTFVSFLGGVAGSHDVYLTTEWRRYFVITNLRPSTDAGAAYLLQVGFQGANAFNLTSVQFVPFTDYGEIPGIVDGFNYLPTRGGTIPNETSRTVYAEKVFFDNSINLRALPVYADNAAATSGGLGVGDLYRTTAGAIHIRH